MLKERPLSRVGNFRGTDFLLAGLFVLPLLFLSEEPGLVLFGAIIFILMLYAFYSHTLPPVLLLTAFFQWFFYYAKLLVAITRGEPVSQIDYVSNTKPEIIFLGLLATASFFVGVFLTSRRTTVLSFKEMKAFCLGIDLRKLLSIYVSVYVLLFIAGNLIWILPGLTQPLFILLLFRWSIFFLLFITVFFQNRFKSVLLLLVLLDVLVSFISFFSNFKEVIYFSFLAYWVFVFQSSIRSKVVAAALVVITIFLGIYWTAIKKDYRDFLNKGTGGQVVLTSRAESYNKLLELAGTVDQARMEKSFDDLIERLSWVGAFDGVYKRVPAKVPHEEGALWMTGITRPFMPRLLFPDKKSLADSKELNKYSALGVDEKNTSISLSMVAGSYVDFGPRGMHFALLVFGLFCGWVYRRAVIWGRHPVIGYGLTMPLIYLMQINEQSINRMVSAMFLYFLVLWFVQRFLLKEFLAVILIETDKRMP